MVVDVDKFPNMEGDGVTGEKGGERMSREWRHLWTLFSISFRNIVRFFKGVKEGM